jgi:hypothetical protein
LTTDSRAISGGADARELDRLVREAVDQAHEHVRRLASERRLLFRHYDFPSLGAYTPSGLPRVSRVEGPLNYAAPFTSGAGDEWHVSWTNVPAIEGLANLIGRNPDLRARLVLPGIEALADSEQTVLLRVIAGSLPLQLLDRLIHTSGHDFSESDFEAAWGPLRNALLRDELAAEVVVPIALTAFDIQEVAQLTPTTRIERLPPGEQLARSPKTIWDAAAHSCVVEAATHAVVITGASFPGGDRMRLDYTAFDFYPARAIDSVFDALRLATRVPVGYAQIYLRPVDWAWHYTADLPPLVSGAFVRRYPPAFDRYGWLRKPARITADEITRAAVILGAFDEAPSNLLLAARRFGIAALRSTEEDAVLDLCIALESALSDKQKTEMTHKLALRSAAVLSRGDDPTSPSQAFHQVKQLYGWRSAIVHGEDPAKAKHRLEQASASARSALEVATSLARGVVRGVVENPELRDTNRIDHDLLLAGLMNQGRPDDDPGFLPSDP